MDIKWVDKKDQNDPSRTELLSAIQKGVNEGKRIKRKERVKARLKVSAWMSGTAASVVLVSGFVFSPINTVLADVPLIGKLYEELDISIGKELAASNLVTEINQKATSNGVDVTVTSAYYDGNVIGVTIKAEGKDLSVGAMDKKHSPETGYTIGGADKDQLVGLRGPLQKLKEGSYVAALEFELKEKELPKNYTLPLQFTLIANKKGIWNFSIPVKQLPVETIKLNESSSTKNGLHKINLNKLSIAKASSTLYYTFDTIKGDLNQDVHLIVFDEHGKRVPLRSNGVENSIEHSEGVKQYRELQLGKIADDVNYLMVYPEVVSMDRENRTELSPIKVLLQ
ncbi:hypothetical protein ABID52_003647 [Fictibacillus halophilus]|uniref:DUF4179 domain-containing protein n=1 Tax=Fictibacillus halophilus TaxID=1610490 RepID=A0ABV2LN66_9BACL|nr:DUF4179 domain-containing protein [Fictibacillus halophilus]